MIPPCRLAPFQVLHALLAGESPGTLQRTFKVSTAKLTEWAELHQVAMWRKPVGQLLRSGIFHVTSLQNAKAIHQSGSILPSGRAGLTGNFKRTHAAELLQAVALFNFPAADLAQATMQVPQISTVLAGISKERIFFKLAEDKLPAMLIRTPPSDCLCVPHVEQWHQGPVPWEAVEGCWFAGDWVNGDTCDLSALLPQLTAAIDQFEAIRGA